jgi:Fe-S-cluster containining protein
MSLAPLSGPPDPHGADCVPCGRCCHHGPETVHLLVADEERLGPELLERLTVLDPRPSAFRFMRNDGTCCAALDRAVPGRFPCRVYERRPDDCRVMQPGSPECLESRRLGRMGRIIAR